MSLARDTLLWASSNTWLRRHVPRWRFVRAATRRFMPGETLDDAVREVRRFAERRLATMLTQLGENVGTEAEAIAVGDDYLAVLDRIAEEGLDTEISVKLTHLGYDLDPEIAWKNLARLLDRASERGNWVWIDMEASGYVDGTLAIYRRALERSPDVGVCLQAYLHRTAADVGALLPLAPSFRLVKGAYREPPDVAVPRKSDMDSSFLRLSEKLLAEKAAGRLRRLAVATHDVDLIGRIDRVAGSRGWPLDSFEIQMLYGIRQADQLRYAKEGRPTRCLIAYGPAWYPWYVRRLAERPANVWFLLRNLVARRPA